MNSLKGTGDSIKSSFAYDKDLSSTDEKVNPNESLPILKMKHNHTRTMSEVIIRKNNFIRIYSKDVELDYKLAEELGQGAYGVVYKASNNHTGAVRAIKQIKRSKISNFDRFINEVNSLAWLDHPNIVKMYEVYHDSVNVYLIMELCTGGELYQRI